MATIDQRIGQVIFGNDPTGYAEGRPEYPARVYEVLRTTCQLSPATNAFEIGAGTGQATFRLLEHGCRVTAVEPDTWLAAVLRASAREDCVKRLSICPNPLRPQNCPTLRLTLELLPHPSIGSMLRQPSPRSCGFCDRVVGGPCGGPYSKIRRMKMPFSVGRNFSSRISIAVLSMVIVRKLRLRWMSNNGPASDVVLASSPSPTRSFHGQPA